MKSQILEQLGQTDLLLPALIAEGLAANDRAKTRLSVLQSAARHARDPQGTRFNLAEECRRVDVDPASMERLVNGAVIKDDDQIVAPGVMDLNAALLEDVGTMARAVEAGDVAQGQSAQKRLRRIGAGAALSSDAIAFAQVTELTGLAGNDGLHRLIMDLHKDLNRLLAAHAEDTVAGARTFGLTGEDRAAVEAFMRGVEQTRKLKFDHPGLATTATRTGARLAIQNDIGETDAHVVVIAVEAAAVIVTYTDVHRARARFFTGLLRRFQAAWSGLDRRLAEGLGDEGTFYLVTGRFESPDQQSRHQFLEAVGAALVFLIDWNKARKTLLGWVPKSDALQILDWAAHHRFGHRGFLQLGGAELLASAVHNVASARIGFGDRLDRALGRAAAIDFLKTVLRICAESLLAGSSVRSVREHLETDLVRRLKRVNDALLGVMVRQAGLAREIASDIAGLLAEQQAHRSIDRGRLVARARRIEEKADMIAVDARNQIMHLGADGPIEPMINSIEDAVDELEQAAFTSSLLPQEVAPELLALLRELANAAVAGAEVVASGASAAADVPDGRQIDCDDTLAVIDRLTELEHDSDAAERALTAMVLQGNFDLRTSLSSLELARALERAGDRLGHFGHLLHRHLLADLST